MREQQVFAKPAFATGDFGIDRYPGQVTVTRERLRCECERHQRRPRRHDGQTELLCDPVAEGRRADPGHGKPARRDHERRAIDVAVRGRDDEARSLHRYGIDGTRHPPLHAAARAFSLEHRDDVARRIVAKELSERLFVIADPIARYQADELRGRVARKRRTAEIRVLRQVVRRTRVHVREIAASAAGDPDLFADDGIVLDQQHAAAALAGLRGAHHAGGAGADHDDVIGLAHPGRRPDAQRMAGKGAPCRLPYALVGTIGNGDAIGAVLDGFPSSGVPRPVMSKGYPCRISALYSSRKLRGSLAGRFARRCRQQGRHRHSIDDTSRR